MLTDRFQSSLIARAVSSLLRTDKDAQPHLASCAVIIWRGLRYVAIRAADGALLALYRHKNRGDLSRLKSLPCDLVRELSLSIPHMANKSEHNQSMV